MGASVIFSGNEDEIFTPERQPGRFWNLPLRRPGLASVLDTPELQLPSRLRQGLPEAQVPLDGQSAAIGASQPVSQQTANLVPSTVPTA